MKKILSVLFSHMMLFSLVACGYNSDSNESNASLQSGKAPESKNEDSEILAVSENNSDNKHNTRKTDSTKEDKMITINITVGNTAFTATLEDNDTAKALVAQLPLTVDMSEHNGNEKYNYLSSNLRADTSSCPVTINEGDLRLYGNNCLVLFYKTFNTSYSYVKLGRINNTTDLEKAVGSGSVQVTFSVIN